jgi:hypothetical protein
MKLIRFENWDHATDKDNYPAAQIINKNYGWQAEESLGGNIAETQRTCIHRKEDDNNYKGYFLTKVILSFDKPKNFNNYRLFEP